MMKIPKNFKAEPFEYHEELALTIDNLTNLGSGVGRHDGWVIMVPYALPGERVKVRIWRNKSNYSDADLVEVLEPSPDRVSPRCELFSICGGCQYQNLRYASQLRWKQEQVAELFQRLAEVKVEVNPPIGSPKEYHYRSKITPHFQRPRDGQIGFIGFQKANTRALVDVPQCPIATEAINEALPERRARVRANARRYKRGGTLLLRDTHEGVVDDMSSVATEKVGELIYQFKAGEFFQNNPYVLPLMIDFVMEAARESGARYLVDTYCGVGVFALAAARHFEAVMGIEVNANAIELANGNARLNQIENAQFFIGKSEAIFTHVPYQALETVIVIDPPRKGCDEAFLEQLFQFGPSRCIYVSCGPDTQARDTKAFLAAGYQIVKVQPFDLFPHTRHIENVVVFDRG